MEAPTSMSSFLEQQKREALGADNKWFCSQFYGYEVTNPDQLLSYYIKNGGACNYRQRYGWIVEEPAAGRCAG